MNRVLAIVLLMLLAHPRPGGAQFLRGEFGAACTQIGASGSMQVALTQNIPANSMIVATAAVANPSAFNNVVSDPVGGNYNVGAVGAASGMVLIPHFRYTTTLLPAGTILTYAMGNATGANACMSISAFGEMVNQTFASASGTNSSGANSTTQTATTSGAPLSAPNLVFMGVGYIGNPGTLTPTSGTALTKTCGGVGTPLCIAASFRVANNVAAYTQTVTSTNSIAWLAGINAQPGARIFGNGFE
jgi:hypothetical protein